MSTEKGSLSISSENIFPVIKKWLYSDHDIFIRELVSNGCDAITKLKKLDIMGEFTPADDEKYKVVVTVDSRSKTLTIKDNGIGMTADEVKTYINQIAFSGAASFLEKYKDKTNEDQIIGHFGLGFYSAFMVADKVTIDSLSYAKDAKAVHWESEGGTEFEMSDSDYDERGTKIVLYLNEDSYEFCNEYRVREILMKYCSFMPTEIFLFNAETLEKEVIEAKNEQDKTEDKKADENSDEDADENAEDEKKEDNSPKPINDTTPLWTKHPNDCTEEEYKEFYRNVFHDYKEPLFWIHLNMDYPFNLKGILYFPKINTEYDTIEGTIKLYNNQVFVADNIKEVIPEFLMLLKGVIDCPDLPLNVSRSALQNDGFVKKISEYISKKVADKLSGMCKVERENYEKFWNDISPFIKFGCLKDTKFQEKMKDYIIFKNLEGKYIALKEYNPDVTGDKDNKKKVYYVTNEQQQSQYISMFKEQGLDALILTHNIDQSFITSLEQHDETIKFERIDADVTDTFKEEVSEDDAKTVKEQEEALTEFMKKALDNDKLTVKLEKLKDASISSMITISEDTRRMQDMMKMYGYGDTSMFAESATLILNANNELVKYIIDNKEDDKANLIAQQLYDLALIANQPLSADAMTKFVERSNKIMMILAGKE